MISSMIQHDLIRLRVPAKDWQEAIRKSGQVLLDAGYILPEYIDAMIDSVKEAGPYVVLAKHLAMPHAKPEYGTLRGGISIVTLENPVCFGSEENDPVKYVFCLSSVNSADHLDLMQSFADILEEADFFELLDKAVSPMEVFNYLEQFDKRGGE